MNHSHSRLSLLSRRLILILVPLAALILSLPALKLGFYMDDHTHRLLLQDTDVIPHMKSPLMDMFAFVDGKPEHTRIMLEDGILPWWSLPHLQLSFWRPLSVMTHMLDYALWPDSPILMHFHNIVWYVVLIILVTLLYRRIMGPVWTAGLAAFFYAVDETHSWPIGWIANRNALISAGLGVVVLLFYDRYRRKNWKPGAWLVPVFLFLGLLSGESTIAITAYLFGYAVCLDSGKLFSRALRLLPSLIAVAAWWAIYHALGFGTFGSDVYINPLNEPWSYLSALPERASVLLLNQWTFTVAGLDIVLPEESYGYIRVAAFLFPLLLLFLLLPLCKRSKVSRFWCIGMLLSLLPACSTFAHDRLLIFSGIGALALAAQLIDALMNKPGIFPLLKAKKILRRLLVWAIITVHAVIAPVMMWGGFMSVHGMKALVEGASETAPLDPSVTGSHFILVNPPIPFIAMNIPVVRTLRKQPLPLSIKILASGHTSVEITRWDAYSVSLRPESGFIAAPLDRMLRSEQHPFRPGWKIELPAVNITVLSTSEDGRPAEALFRFNMPLEDQSFIWLQWKNNGYESFTPPEIGLTVALPPNPAHLLFLNAVAYSPGG